MLKLVILVGVTFGLGGCGVINDRIKTRTAQALIDTPPDGQILDVNGSAVHLYIEGTGPDVIVIHGAGGNWKDFTFGLIPALKDQFRFIAIDRPAHGHSGRISTRAGKVETIAEQAELIHAAAQMLGAKNPIVLGQSYGGAVALAYGLAHPDDTSGLVLISSVANPWEGKLDIYYRATGTWFGQNVLIPLAAAFSGTRKGDATLDKIFAPDPVPEGYLEHMGLGLALRTEQLRVNTQMINQLHAEMTKQSKHYEALKMPIEIVHGTADTIVPYEVHALPLSKRLPNVEMTTLEGIGHMPHHIDLGSTVAALRRAAKRAGLR